MGFIYGFELSQQGMYFNHQHWKYPQSWNMLYGMLYYYKNVLVVDQKTLINLLWYENAMIDVITICRKANVESKAELSKAIAPWVSECAVCSSKFTE